MGYIGGCVVMRKLSWRMNRAHVWLDHMPNWVFHTSQVFHQTVAAPDTRLLDTRVAAIELFIPAGARIHYGALGGRYTPERSGELIIQVCASTAKQERLNNTLAAGLDTVCVGLPAEYADEVIQGAIAMAIDKGLGAGTVSLCQAAHGVAGSSRWMFRSLGAAVTTLLTDDYHVATDADLIDLLREISLR